MFNSRAAVSSSSPAVDWGKAFSGGKFSIKELHRHTHSAWHSVGSFFSLPSNFWGESSHVKIEFLPSSSRRIFFFLPFSVFPPLSFKAPLRRLGRRAVERGLVSAGARHVDAAAVGGKKLTLRISIFCFSQCRSLATSHKQPHLISSF